jgi:hypothetical protein
MRKHFLLLFMALMSLTGWAQTADLLDADVSFSHIQYGGGFPVMQVLYKGQVLEQDVHFTWDGKYYTDAACETEAEAPLAVTGEGEKYYVKLIGKEGTVYENSATKGWFTVEPADLKITSITNVEKDYNGEYSDIEVSIDDITFDGFVLEEDEDNLTVADHIYVQYGPADDPAINAGSYTITGVTGISSGNYNITIELADANNKAKINAVAFPEEENLFVITPSVVTYSAEAATLPTVTTSLTEDDYTIAWYNNAECAGDAIAEPKDAGKYYAKITGKGNYNVEDVANNVVTFDEPMLTINRKAVIAYVNNMEKVYDGHEAALDEEGNEAELIFNGLIATDVEADAIKALFDATFVADGDHINAGTYAMVPATGANVVETDQEGNTTYEVISNYTIKLLNTGIYTITKRPVSVKAKTQTFVFNGEERAIDTNIKAATVEVTAATETTGLVGQDNLATIAELFSLSQKEGVTIKAQGTYEGAIVITPQVVEGANYSIEGTDGDAEVTGKALILLASTFTKPYGYTVDFSKDFSVVNTANLTADDWKAVPEFTVSQGDKTFKEGDLLPTGTYTITISNAADIIPDNYEFEGVEGVDLYTGELTITALPITININPVNLNAGATVDDLKRYASVADYTAQLVDAADKDEIDEAIEFAFAEGVLIDGKLGSAADYVNNPAFNAETNTYTGGVVAAEIENDKYDITIVAGNIKIGAAGTLVLDPTDTQLNLKIEDAAGAEENAFNVSFANLTMRANEWYAMVLPFDIDPKEMVYAAKRYVIFNELNKAGTTAEAFKFTLKFEPIEAGTPFLVKFAGDEGEVVNWSEFGAEGVAFAAVEISDKITETETDYVTFTGTYDSDKELQGSRTDGSENYVWWLCDKSYKEGAKGNNWLKPMSKPHPVKPMEAWLVGNTETWEGYAPRITVEDFDGQTTSIKSISVEQIHNMTVDGMYNLNGMKMNNVPTQKGIYIINGKKVVIK